MGTIVSIERNMAFTGNSTKTDKELTRRQLISMLKDSLKSEMVAVKRRQQILEELEALDR
jgi:hypothetical protein